MRRGLIKEESQFVGTRMVDTEGIGLGPLGVPGCLGTDGYRREKVGGDGVEVKHLMVGGLVVCGRLIDEPDFDGIVYRLLFMVSDADDDCRGFIAGEVPGISFRFSIGPQEVEFGECFSIFGEGDDVDERGDDENDDNGKDDGEGAVKGVFLFGEIDFVRDLEAFRGISFFPAVDADCADTEDENQEGDEDRFQANPPGRVIEEKPDEGDDCDR